MGARHQGVMQRVCAMLTLRLIHAALAARSSMRG